MKTRLERDLLLLALLFGSAYALGSLDLQRALAQTPAAHPAVETQRIPQFENDEVKVWRSVIAANQPLTMHRHEHPRVIVALSGGTLMVAQDSGKTESHVWETGKAYWLPANAPGTMHADVNQGDQPIEVMVVELKQENK